jgi:chromosome segregation ATPase
MLSSNSVASRDSRDSFNDLNSSIRSNEGGELSRPKISPRSAKPPKSVGRRIINNLDSLTKPKEKGVETSTIKITDSTTMEELDHILEEDALKLINMKKDVFSAQQDELAKLKASVMNVKKEYDSLRALNSYKAKSLQALSDKKMNLSELDRSDSANNTAGHHVLNTLRQQTSEILLQLTEEQRTSKMLTLMIKRLDDEIGQCRMEIAQLTVQSDQAKHDAAVTQGSLIALRQELLEQENHLAKINSTLKTRKEERSNKINVLQTMSVEGGSSFMRIQQTLHDNSKVRPVILSLSR